MMKKLIFWPTLLFVVAVLCVAQDRVEFKTIDGVPHVFNPAKPLKGTKKLEVERTRTIDPYKQPDVGLRTISFSRDDAGQVILYDRNGAEAHRFSPEGEYMGLLTKKGQGPGEFGPKQGYLVYFFNPDIWVFGGMKAARFDRNGLWITDRTLRNRCFSGVDAERFLTIDIKWIGNNDQVRTLKLAEFAMEGEEKSVDLLQAENIGMIRSPNGKGGFTEGWATPNLFYTADPGQKRIYCGLNTDYRILAKDYSGKDVQIIQKVHENAKIRRADIEKLLPMAFRDKSFEWMISAYPDRFAAILDVKVLPQDHLGVFRITGAGMFEIDVFSPRGEYLYALIPPGGVAMSQASFFSTGFATVEHAEDYSVYREYRIKNLSEVFGK